MKPKFYLIKLTLLSSLAVAADSENNSNAPKHEVPPSELVAPPIPSKPFLLDLSKARKRFRSGSVDITQVASPRSPSSGSPIAKYSPHSAVSPLASPSSPSSGSPTAKYSPHSAGSTIISPRSPASDSPTVKFFSPSTKISTSAPNSPTSDSPLASPSSPTSDSPTAKFSPPSDHFKKYAQFYAELQKGEIFIEDFRNAVTAGSLSSTLFRANERGDSVDRVIGIVKCLSDRGSDIFLTYEDQREMVSSLIEIWETMCQTHDTFIEQTVMKCIAKYILEGKFVEAAALIDGAKKNLNGFICLFTKHGQFIQDLLDSQRDLLIYGRASIRRSNNQFRKHLSTASYTKDEVSVSMKAANSDFSICGLRVTFEERLGEVNLLAFLIPATQEQALDLLSELVGKKKKDLAKSQKKLTRKTSKVFQPTTPTRPRSSSVSSITPEYPSPNSPRRHVPISPDASKIQLDATLSSESPPQSNEKKTKKEKKKKF